MKLYT